jgi:cytochrome c556
MDLQAFNLGPLGSMAKGETPYDAELAGKLAADLVALSGMLSGPAFSLYFPAGTAAGEVEGTRAKAEIWATPDDFLAKAKALSDAATALAATSDLAGLQGAMGAVGGACGSCHEAYRVSN